MDKQASTKGFSLIEVLVAMLVMGCGVIGFVALSLTTSQRVEEAGYRAQAQVIAQDVIERIKANAGAWPTDYNDAENRWNAGSSLAPACTPGTPCTTPSALAAQDVSEILSLVSRLLPAGAVVVRETCNPGEGLPCVVVTWLNSTSSSNTSNSCDTSISPADDEHSHCLLTRFWPGGV